MKAIPGVLAVALLLMAPEAANAQDAPKVFANGHTDVVIRLNFSPDARLLVSLSLDGTAKVWALSTGNLLHSFPGERGAFVVAAAFTPDGKSLAIAEYRRGRAVVNLRDVESGENQTLSTFQSRVEELAFSPDGRWLAVGLHHDLAVRIVDRSTREVVSTLEAHKGSAVAIRNLRFSGDGRWLVSASSGKEPTLRLWRSDNWQPVWTSQLPAISDDVIFAQDGASMLVSTIGGTILVLDVPTGNVARRTTHPVGTVNARPTGHAQLPTWAISEHFDGRTVNTVTATAVFSLINGGIIELPNSKATFNHDGRILALPEALRLVDTATGDVLRAVSTAPVTAALVSSFEPPVHAVAFSPDGRWVASDDGYGGVVLWDAATGTRRIVWGRMPIWDVQIVSVAEAQRRGRERRVRIDVDVKNVHDRLQQFGTIPPSTARLGFGVTGVGLLRAGSTLLDMQNLEWSNADDMYKAAPQLGARLAQDQPVALRLDITDGVTFVATVGKRGILTPPLIVVAPGKSARFGLIFPMPASPSDPDVELIFLRTRKPVVFRP